MYIYVYIYVHSYTYIDTHIFYIYIHTYIHIHVHACVHIHSHQHLCSTVGAFIDAHRCMYVSSNKYGYVRDYTRISIDIPVNVHSVVDTHIQSHTGVYIHMLHRHRHKHRHQSTARLHLTP